MDQLPAFKTVRQLAEDRKGGKEGLEALLNRRRPLTPEQLAQIPDDRFLAMMTKRIFQAGFTWQVIEHMWPGFEEAFHGFNPLGLAHMPPENWEAYMDDRRVARHWRKIKSILDNAHFVIEESQRHGSFGGFLAGWPPSDQAGLLFYLRKHGSRLGGNTGMYFLRMMGKDGFILSHDVVSRLQASGVEIGQQPTTKKELQAAQQAFNAWHAETGLPYTDLSKIVGYSIGRNPHPK